MKVAEYYFGHISKLGGSVNGVYHGSLNKVFHTRALEVSFSKILLTFGVLNLVISITQSKFWRVKKLEC